MIFRFKQIALRGAGQKGMTMFKTTKLCPFCASDKNRLVELDADNHKEYAVMCEK